VREYEFRGKRISNGEWIYGLLIKSISRKYTIQREVTDHKFLITDLVDIETVGEYTGLKDKEGKKIFEGDILKLNNNTEDLVEVKFGQFGVIDVETESVVDNALGWYSKVIPTDEISKLEPYCFDMPLTEWYISNCSCEIIDNIYENKELM